MLDWWPGAPCNLGAIASQHRSDVAVDSTGIEMAHAQLDKCYLHIGLWKTGTTRIQSALFDNRQSLAAAGYVYPASSANHTFLVSAFHQDAPNWLLNRMAGRNTTSSLQQYHSEQLAGFEAELCGAPAGTLLLSSEHLLGLNDAALMNLRRYLERFVRQIEIVCYVRHPVSHAVSAAQEAIKAGQQTLQEVLSRPQLYVHLQYELGRMVEIFGKGNIILRDYDRIRGRKGDVLHDFLDVAGLDENLLIQPSGLRANESLSMEAALVASALTEQFPLLDPGRFANDYLARIPGQTFSLPRWWTDNVADLAKQDLRYLREVFGVDLVSPGRLPCADDAPRLWGPSTIKALARELNRLAAMVNAAQTKVAELSAQLDKFGK